MDFAAIWPYFPMHMYVGLVAGVLLAVGKHVYLAINPPEPEEVEEDDTKQTTTA